MKTCYSAAKHAELHAQTHKLGLGPIQPSYSCPKATVLHAKKTHRRGREPIDTCYSGAKQAVLFEQMHR